MVLALLLEGERVPGVEVLDAEGLQERSDVLADRRIDAFLVDNAEERLEVPVR